MGLRSGEQETGPRDGGNVVAVTVGRRLGDRKGKGEGGSSPSSLVSPLLASSLFRREPPSRGCAIAKRRIREQAILTGVRVPGPPSTGCIVSTRIWEVVFVWSPFTSWAQSAEEVSLGDAAQRGISAGVFFFSPGQMGSKHHIAQVLGAPVAFALRATLSRCILSKLQTLGTVHFNTRYNPDTDTPRNKSRLAPSNL